MRKIIFILLVITLNCYAQTSSTKYWLDPEGKEIKIKYLNLLSEKFPDNAMAFRKTADSGIVYQFNAPKYSTYKVDYTIIKTEIEKITNKTYTDSTIFLINFNYLDDNCSDWFSNNLSSDKINDIKTFIEPIKKGIEYKSNVIYLAFFENGIVLKNKPESKREYFFSDQNNFFKKNLFINATICGSIGLIKPNGQTLIRNGEYRPDWMNDHLKPEIWNLIFQQ